MTTTHSRVLGLNLKDAEKYIIAMALRRSQGNKARAADLLGINRKTLTEKMKLYNIQETERL